MRLWDIIFLEGPQALFASMLALFDLFIPTVGGKQGVLLAADALEGDMTAFEVMQFFKQESAHGIASDTDTVFASIHHYMEMIPKTLIDDWRAEVMRTELERPRECASQADR